MVIMATIPIIDSQQLKNNFIKNCKSKKGDLNSNIVKMNIYLYQKNGNFNRIVKELPVNIIDELMYKLNKIELSIGSYKKLFEEKFDILKEYDIISDNVTLNDIFDVNKLRTLGEKTDNVSGEDFFANSSFILFAGIGLGVGLGPGLRLFNGFQHFLLAMAGLGYVFCYDIEKDTLYTLQTFLFPVLIGYLSDYVGIIMFAVFPGILYSNFFSFGYTSFTFWFQMFL